MTDGVGPALQVGSVPGLETVTGTALLGVAVAVAVWLLRLVIRRRRGRTGAAVPDARGLDPGDEDLAVAATRGSAAADVAVAIPLPGTQRDAWPIRHAELYAVELGLVAGGLVAWLASLATVDPLVGGVVGSAMGALSLWRVRSMALETARQESGLWLVATAVGLAGGWLLFL